jgi:glycosyltransferase involved in cell wall biosynthesis
LPETSSLEGLKVCWIGGTRYTHPLNPTQDAKWCALSTLGIEPYIIGFANGLHFRRFTQHARFRLLPELPLPVLRYAEMFTLTPIMLLWLIFRHNLSVIIAQSPFEGVAGAFVKQLAHLFGKRIALVVESHGNFEVTVFRQRRVTFARLYHWVMMRAARYVFRHSDVLRAVSDSTRAQLQTWSPGKLVEQFMTWTDLGAFQDIPREKPLSESHDLVYAGVLTALKNVHVLIEAFAQVQDVAGAGHLWIVGKPEDAAYAEGLHRQVEQLGLTDRVTFVGAVSQRELAGYMARARALVLVSSTEGLPRVMVEAMLSGLAVIGSRVGGIPEIVTDGDTGYLIPPDDGVALVDALRTMYLNPQIDAMGARAQTFARRFFSTDAYVDGYRRLLAAAMKTLTLPPLTQGEGRKINEGQ